jgi:hypothetical protein
VSQDEWMLADSRLSGLSSEGRALVVDWVFKANAEGKAQERATVVKWLRGIADYHSKTSAPDPSTKACAEVWAGTIEDGGHEAEAGK